MVDACTAECPISARPAGLKCTADTSVTRAENALPRAAPRALAGNSRNSAAVVP